MDPNTSITLAVRLAKGLYDLYASIQLKRESCKELFDRCNRFVPALEKLDETGDVASKLDSITAFVNLMQEISQHCQRYTRKSYIRQLVEEFGPFGADLNKFHKDLAELEIQFSLNVDQADFQPQLEKRLDECHKAELAEFNGMISSMVVMMAAKTNKFKPKRTLEMFLKENRLTSAVSKYAEIQEEIENSKMDEAVEKEHFPAIDVGGASGCKTAARPLSKNRQTASLEELFQRVKLVDMDFLAPDSKDQKLGCGSFSDVYLSTYHGKPVAKKVFRGFNLKSKDEESQKQIRIVLREILITQKLQHENVISILGSDLQRGFVLLELSEFSLSEYLYEKKNFNFQINPFQILFQIASGLRYLHFMGIVHRDVNPMNILFVRESDETFVAKLAGLSAAANIRSMILSFSVGNSNDVMSALLSTAYMAPEAFVGGVREPSADVFSFGILANELFRRDKPWPPGVLDFSLADRVCNKRERPILFKASTAQERELMALIGNSERGCLQQEPEQRPNFVTIVSRLFDILCRATPQEVALQETMHQSRQYKALSTSNPTATTMETAAINRGQQAAQESESTWWCCWRSSGPTRMTPPSAVNERELVVPRPKEVPRPVILEPQIEVNEASLLAAASKGSLNEVKYLLQHGVDVNCKDENFSSTPLHLASSQGNLQVVQYLVERGADFESKNKSSDTPLHKAATEGRKEVVEYLMQLDGVNINCQNARGWTPFQCSYANHKPEMVDYLLQRKGVDKTIREGGLRQDIPIFNNLKSMNAGSSTPLFVAVSSGSLGEIQKQLQSGADVNSRDGKSSFTPLHVASSQGNLAAVRFLVDHGADYNCKTRANDTPLHTAASAGRIEVAKYLLQLEGVDINCQNRRGWTPLHCAAACRKLDMVKYLLQEGADKTVTDGGSNTPYHVVPDIFDNSEDADIVELKKLLRNRMSIKRAFS